MGARVREAGARNRSRFFLLENVDQLGKKRGKDFVGRIQTELRGYDLYPHFYNCADYGLAQTRVRFVIVGRSRRVKARFQALQTDGLTIPSDANGNAIYSNIYYERLAESTDTVGPRIVGWNSANGVDLLPKLSGMANAIGVNSQYFVLTFDEPMLAGDPTLNPDSVYDLSNYQLYNSSGTQISNAITHIDYGVSEVAQVAAAYGNGLNPIPDNRWEVVLTIDGGTTPLPDGTYTLVVLNAIPSSSTTAGQTGLRDIYGTPLNLTGYNPTGSDFTSTVTITQSLNAGQIPAAPGLTMTDKPINNTRGGEQIDPAVAATNNFSASNPAVNGNYVVVWTSIVNGATNIVGELFQSNGTQIGPEFVVNNTASASWGNADVAMAADGNFVITWSGAGPNSNPLTSPSDIFARRYNAKGQPVGNQFQVDQYSTSTPNQSAVQNESRVAMAPDGTFIITWTSTPISVSNTNTPNSAIYAREYNADGVPVNANASTAAFQPGASAFLVSKSLSTAEPFARRGDGRHRRLRDRLGGRFPVELDVGRIRRLFHQWRHVRQRHDAGDDPGAGALEQHAQHARQFHRNWHHRSARHRTARSHGPCRQLRDYVGQRDQRVQRLQCLRATIPSRRDGDRRRVHGQ